MKYKNSWSSFLVVMLLISNSVWSQTEPDEVALAEDAFQENFYESLKQKGIENYDKAIVSLQKCQLLKPENDVVYFELGKNYLDLKDYYNAQENFEKATKIDPNNRWYWVGLYDVAYAQRDYNKAIEVILKLIPFKSDYKEDLTSLYMYTSQFDKAMVLIDELNESVGKTDMRENYKAQIMTTTKYQGLEKEKLLEAIKKNPKEEYNYISLIYMYSDTNQEEKAFEIAKKLEKEIPKSDWAQVSLFKFHLNANDGDKAVQSMNKVFKSNQIDNKIKHRILNEFLIFVKNNPKYNTDLENAIQYFNSDKEVKVAKEIGKFYQNKEDWVNALKYYELFESTNSDDVENKILLLNAYSKNSQFDVLSLKAASYIELFPLQPDFYYYAGLAQNQLKNHKKAIDFLELGLDYIVDNKITEANFYEQLSESYAGLGDLKKKESYKQKADNLVKK